jgi:hypothetical protein
VHLVHNIFTFNALGTHVDLTGPTNPGTVVLTIGINRGTTTAGEPSNEVTPPFVKIVRQGQKLRGNLGLYSDRLD